MSKPFSGACCVAGDCEFKTHSDCEAINGIFKGVNVQCVTTNCAVSSGSAMSIRQSMLNCNNIETLQPEESWVLYEFVRETEMRELLFPDSYIYSMFAGASITKAHRN